MLLWITTLFAPLAIALNPIDNYCKLWNHRSVVKYEQLYIDGGDMVQVDYNNNGYPEGAQYYGYNFNLLAVDLTQPWDWKSETSSKDIYTQYSKENAVVPIVQRGGAFSGGLGDNNIYFFGGSWSSLNTSAPGYSSPWGPAQALTSFDTVEKTFGEYSDNLLFNQPIVAPNAGSWVSVPDLGLLVYLNGQVDQGSSSATVEMAGSSYPVDAMVVIDTRNHSAVNLSSISLHQMSPSTRSSMVAIPNIGASGALFQLGGLQSAAANDNSTDPVISLEAIAVFDLSTYNPANTFAVWLQQTATGDIPAARRNFCLVAVSAADNSSHHVYLYGGRNESAFFDDIYVLSLPSFIWTRVYGPGVSPRAHHTCHLVGGTTLISVGGIRTDDILNGCDWETKGLGVYNLNNNIWSSKYNASTQGYQIPQPITALIGGGPNGGSNVTAPKNGFSDSRVQALFNEVPAKNSNNPSTGDGTRLQERRGLEVGPIVGIVVGVVVFVLLIGVLWWKIRSHAKRIASRMRAGRTDSKAGSNGTAGRPASKADLRSPNLKFRYSQSQRDLEAWQKEQSLNASSSLEWN